MSLGAPLVKHPCRCAARRAAALAFVGVALAGAPPARAAAIEPARWSDAAAQALVEPYARDGRFWGTVLVARRGKVLFEHAYGWADSARRIPNTAGTRYEIASLTKQFTGMAITQLAAAGKLGLHDSVGRYYAEAPLTWKRITIDELLTHTSGLPNNQLKDFTRGVNVPYTPAELVATFRDRPLQFSPGQGWSYTNTEYYLLGYILEKVSGERYGDYLERHLFQPLGMTHSGLAPTDAPVESLAVGYTRDDGRLRPRDPFDRSLELAAGGVHSTVGDLLIWDRAIADSKPVPAGWMARVFEADNQGHYGYGWFVERDEDGEREWHEGSDPGYGAFILRRPFDGVLVVVLSNLEGAPVRDIALGLEKLVDAR